MKPSSRPPRTPSGLCNFCILLFVTCSFLSDVSSATPRINLSTRSGPPTSRILVSGQGFEPNVGVDIYFDTEDEALVARTMRASSTTRSSTRRGQRIPVNIG